MKMKLLIVIALLVAAGPVFAQSYTYSIANDMPNGQVFPGKLRAEIVASSISTTLVDILTDGDVLTIKFQSALSAGDKTTLDGDTTNPAGGLLALSPQTQVLADTPIDQEPTTTDPATNPNVVTNWTNIYGLPQYSFGGSVYEYITTTSDQFDSLTLKGAPVSGDLILIEDSEAGNAKKYVTAGSLGGGGDVTAASTITDNSIVRGDGGAKGVQQSSATIDDAGLLTATDLCSTNTLAITSQPSPTPPTVDSAKGTFYTSSDGSLIYKYGTYTADIFCTSCDDVDDDPPGVTKGYVRIAENDTIKSNNAIDKDFFLRFKENDVGDVFLRFFAASDTGFARGTESLSTVFKTGGTQYMKWYNPGGSDIRKDGVTLEVGTTGSGIKGSCVVHAHDGDAVGEPGIFRADQGDDTGLYLWPRTDDNWYTKNSLPTNPQSEGDMVLTTKAAQFSTLESKASPVGADILLIEDSADSNKKKRVTITSLPGGATFGNDYQTGYSGGVSSTSSATFQDKLTVTTGTLTGTYIVFFTMTFLNNDKESEMRLYDSTNTTVLHSMLARLKTGEGTYTGHVILSFTSQSRALKLQWRDTGAINNQDVEQARITIWRVN